MVFKQLLYLVALAREQHFGRAAEACAISQPTLSAAIRQLEEELGVTIVERGQRFRGFTPEGQSILEHAQRIVADFEALRQDARAMTGGLAGRLTIGVIPTALPAIADLTRVFHGRHPAVVVRILSLTSSEIQRRLDAFEIDAGVTYLDFEPIERVRKAPLYRESYVLLTPDDGRFGRDRLSATWAEAATLPLCLLTPDMQNRRIVDAIFQRSGHSPRVEVESNAMTNLWSLVATGVWSSILPKALIDVQGVPPRTRALALEEGDHAQRVGVVVPDRSPLRPISAAFVEAASGSGGGRRKGN